MSIFKIGNKKDDSCYTLFDVLQYIRRQDAADIDTIYGAGVSVTYTFEEMMNVKETYGQENGKAYFHYIFNPAEDDIIDDDRFFDMSVEMANYLHCFSGTYQVLMSIHHDKERLHVHFVANNIDTMTGQRMNMNMKRLFQLREGISKIAEAYGISAIRQYNPSIENDEI